MENIPMQDVQNRLRHYDNLFIIGTMIFVTGTILTRLFPSPLPTVGSSALGVGSVCIQRILHQVNSWP